MGDRPTILVVDDEESYRDALTVSLVSEGFHVEVAADGIDALSRFASWDPALVLLDVLLPGLSGIDVCRELRRRSGVPIIMVTARGDEIDTVVGLEVGADGYVAKPFRLREMIARVRATLRRASLSPHDLSDDVVQVGDVRLDAERHEVWVRGEAVELPLKEFELLRVLLDNAGRVVTRDTLVDSVWGSSYFGSAKTLDVHIRRLRGRIDDGCARPRLITTVRGVGYRFEDR